VSDLTELRQLILKFRDDRNWKQFHQVKDLVSGLQIESSELAELFLFKSDQQIKEISKEKIEDELADVFVYLNYLADYFEIDLVEATRNKLAKNALKYPVEKARDSNKKYDEF
jgi:NTP pyrophosphatase (non-canonical NTP hydrolase)